jgi:alpha-amylase
MSTPPSVRARLLSAALAFLLVPLAATAAPAPVAVPRFTHPGTGQVFYFVMTDRFANGRTDNDTGGFPGGPMDHGFDPTRISHFHGGDFAGLTARLDYLKNLGVTSVWVTPPFRNKPVQQGTAGYHGYWITDFLAIDPHLGTNDEYRAFIRSAHERGLRVYMDIIVNHTADVMEFTELPYEYRTRALAPYRDAAGQAFDERKVAYNGLGPATFPALDAKKSFPFQPVIAESERQAKHPAWLNDPTLYHNRGNSTFAGENSTLGDFAGLDDLFTEHPRVVQGMIEIFNQWVEYGADGFRIDTMRHVNNEFWQAFNPAIRAKARALGRPDFIQFGEVYNDPGDPAILSEFSTNVLPADTTIDFGFFAAARRFVSQGGTAGGLADFFARDDFYTDHDSNVHTTTTFLGNHDAGRFGHFLLQDNAGASRTQLEDLVRLGHGLMYLVRGQPILYYGDEQGMVGAGGHDQQARETMFGAVAPAFRDAWLLGTARTGKDDKFDPQHPFYRFFSRLGALRAAHPALRTGAMLLRPTADPALFAFSRIERGERVEYVAAFNNSRVRAIRAALPTSQPAGARLAPLFDSRSPEAAGGPDVVAGADGSVEVTLAPLQFAVWRAAAPVAAPAERAKVTLVLPGPGAAIPLGTREYDGLTFPLRREFRAEVIGGDGVGEMTFVLRRESRPGQLDLIGTDDNAPYRVFWSPPADLAPGEKFEVVATFDDLRGHRVAAAAGGLTLAPTQSSYGIAGSRTPTVRVVSPAEIALAAGSPLELRVEAEGSGALEYQWLRDGAEIPGAHGPAYVVARATDADAGEYRALVRNLAGTALSGVVTVKPAAARGPRTVRHADFPSRQVAARHIDVWLPPGYDASSGRYPVVYMHDGQNLFDPATSYGGIPWSVDQALLRLIARGEARPAIIVGVWNSGTTRFQEYMPQAASSAPISAYSGLPRVSPGELRSDAYLRFLVEELKPFIDRTYRTRPEPGHTFVMGSSMGGLISAYAVCEYPQVFGGAGCVSTHWPAGDGVVVDYLARKLPSPGTHRFYFDFGTETVDALYEPYQRRVDEVMRAAGYVPGPLWETRKFPGTEHNERAWKERVDIPLRFLLGT